jgi:MHS family proline/betaine transporter-like MFS transporter
LAIAVVLALDVTNYLVLSYLPNLLSGTLGYDTTHSLLLTVVTMLVMLVAIPFVGRLADRVGRRPVLAAACLGYIVLSVPALWLLQRGSGSAILAGLLLLGLRQTLFIGTTPSALPEMFPTSHRYSGMALAFNIAASLFGGTAPMVAEYLVRTRHREPIHARLLHDGCRADRPDRGLDHARDGEAATPGITTHYWRGRCPGGGPLPR